MHRSAGIIRSLARTVMAAGLFLAVAGCGQAEAPKGLGISEALGVDTTGYRHAEADRRLQFPRDHGPHPDFYLEWWYFTGNLSDANGRPFGYQFTIFRNALAPPGPEKRVRSVAEQPEASPWTTRQLYSAHLAVSNPSDGEFLSGERYARGAMNLAGAEVGASPGFRVWVEDWVAEGDSLLSWISLKASEPGFGIELDLRPSKPLFLQGENGYSRKGPADRQASHYYSITRLASSGRLVLGNDTFEVTGNSWLDREWSTSLLSDDQTGWDWFSLQFDNGQDLMFFRLRSEIKDFVDGSRTGNEGQALPFNPEAISLRPTTTWRSPRTGIEYPTAWRMEAPDQGIRLDIQAALPNQELDTRVRYWEGSVSIQGQWGSEPVTGRGYVELTGYQ